MEYEKHQSVRRRKEGRKEGWVLRLSCSPMLTTLCPGPSLAENPCPEQGDIIQIKLSEHTEVLPKADGTGSTTMLVDTVFEMNYATGQWTRLKKYKPITNTSWGSPGDARSLWYTPTHFFVLSHTPNTCLHAYRHLHTHLGQIKHWGRGGKGGYWRGWELPLLKFLHRWNAGLFKTISVLFFHPSSFYYCFS